MAIALRNYAAPGRHPDRLSPAIASTVRDPEIERIAVQFALKRQEAEGRAETGEIALTVNEYNTATCLGEDYWLDVLFHSETEPTLNILRDSATLDWQAIVRVEHYRLRQDSLKHPIELKEYPKPYG